MMRNILKTGGASIAGLFVFLAVGGAQAAMVNFTVTGEVDSAYGTPFGLDVGFTITVSGTFDDSVISTAPYTVYFDSANSSSNTMTIVAGSYTWDQTQDDSYGSGGPNLVLDGSGNFVGINFHALLLDGSAFDSFSSTFAINDDAFNEVNGTWTASTFSMTPVPVPAAVWLFGSGLLGLVGLARRKK